MQCIDPTISPLVIPKDKNRDRTGKVPDVAQELAGVSTGSGSFSLPREMFKELEAIW